MAIFGTDLDAYFQVKADMAYSLYLDNTKKNRLFRNTMFVCTDKKYLNLETQKAFDEIAALITTNGVFPVNNNQTYTSPLQISGIQINTPSPNIATVITVLPHNLIGTQAVVLSGVQSSPALVPPLNGGFVATVTGANSFTIPYPNISGTYISGTGQFISANMVSDYMHLYAVKCKFLDPLKVQVSNSSGASPIRIYFARKNKIRNGDQIIISGATINAAINGTWFVKQVSPVSYQLYFDADLLIPSTGGITNNTPEGSVSQVWYEYAKPNFSDRKIDPYNDPSVELPKYETANKLLKFYPLNRVCSEINIDYITKPSVFIDVANSTTDLSLVYPEKYLYFIVDVAIQILSTPLRDRLLNQEITQEIIQNP